MNAINYPYIISGKPYVSLPAFIPVVFELTILFASFGAFFGMWGLILGLPVAIYIIRVVLLKSPIPGIYEPNPHAEPEPSSPEPQG